MMSLVDVKSFGVSSRTSFSHKLKDSDPAKRRRRDPKRRGLGYPCSAIGWPSWVAGRAKSERAGNTWLPDGAGAPSCHQKLLFSLPRRSRESGGLTLPLRNEFRSGHAPTPPTATSGSTRVVVSLEYGPRSLTLRVADDGTGIPAGAIDAAAAASTWGSPACGSALSAPVAGSILRLSQAMGRRSRLRCQSGRRRRPSLGIPARGWPGARLSPAGGRSPDWG
jgi:hypothetical protein